jgi:LytS/YehU family sensor histidine kinase
VTTYDFIFSNQLRYRVTRHTAFWIIWWLYVILAVYLPSQPFKGWNLSGPHPILDKYGLAFFIKKTLFFNTLIPAVLPHATFTYAIIYFLLPRLFLKRKNIGAIICLCIGITASFFLLSIILMYVPYYHSRVSGIRTIMPSLDEVIQLTFKSSLVNVPVVTGIAVMIKLVKRWWIKQKETEQLTKEKAKAELQLLKAQIHPHFLFNTLNNIYFFTLSNSKQAPEMIKKLSGMLNYILNECNQPTVPLNKELKMIQDYMALEKIRYGEQMDMGFEIKGNCDNKLIAPLLLIPFVENSFKHGASKMLMPPSVKLNISVEEKDLHFLLTNNTPGAPIQTSRNGSIGLKNVKKRLQLLYPATHELNIISESGIFTVFMKIRLEENVDKVNTEEINHPTDYAMA